VIQFLLNNELVNLDKIDPNTTVLQYLRDMRSRKGTKEGCASGDCGACTVVTVELDADNQLVYKNINACITFVSALNGKQLLSIEDIKPDQGLHCTQQAMVDNDGSQCGYCTPGFVMSLFALKKHQSAYDKHSVHQALAGNLCRCTGYRAIDSAAEQALNTYAVDHFEPLIDNTKTQLANLANNADELNIGHDTSHCHIPQNITALASLYLTHPDSTLLAGGTDLAITVTQHHQPFSRLISLANVAELKEVSIEDKQIVIGAAVSLDECQRLVAPFYEDFSKLFDRFASLQIRHQATLAGNIANASPIGDTPPALIALDAQLTLRKGAVQRVVSIADFFTDYRKTVLQPSEFIENIVIPTNSTTAIKGSTLLSQENFHFKIYKVSKRLDDDISAICVACFLQLDEQQKVSTIRLAYGGMAAIAKRAQQTEQALLGKAWNIENVAQAVTQLSNDFQPMSDFRASNRYRLLCAENLLYKFFHESQHSLAGDDNDDLTSKGIDPKIQRSHLKTRISDYV